MRRGGRAGLSATGEGLPLIAALCRDHWPEVARIYREGIASGHATFETDVPAWEHFDSSHLARHRYVALRGEDVLGWVAAGPVSSREAYRGVVEHSIYVGKRARGQGVGQLLLGELIASTEAAGIWTIETRIFPENGASLRLHERLGFEVVGRRRRLGKLHGVWRDVLLLERRSDAVD